MFRDCYQELVSWKDKATRKPLLVTGVRQCGKTYLIEQFAKEQFSSYVYVNFESSEHLSDIFDYDFDTARIVTEIERTFKTSIVPGETLVFF